jgi:hypothetical protein
MALIEIKRDPSPREVRQFSFFWLPGLCGVLAVVAAYHFESPPAAATLVAAGAASVALGAVSPRVMRGVFLGWMWAAFPIGWLVSHALIAAIYFLLITPMAVVMRLAGRDPLGRRFERDAETYWVRREPTRDPARYFRQF